MFVWERAGALRQYEVSRAARPRAAQRTDDASCSRARRSKRRATARRSCCPASVTSKDAADKAVSVAAGYVEKAGDVVNLLQLQETQASNQVLLRVRFAEVSRSAMTELGRRLFTSPTGINNTHRPGDDPAVPGAGLRRI